jgi:membrane protease YdiL (CAAX protease family)
MARSAGVRASYWTTTREPRYSLVFVLPFIVAYQVGILILAHAGGQGFELRNAADVLMRQVVGLLGLSGNLVSGAVVIVVLFAWHAARGKSWRLRTGYVLGMGLESVLYGLVLILLYAVVVVRLESRFLASSEGLRTMAGQLVLGIGAGVYEEFLFRLVLIGCIGYLLRRLGAGWLSSMAVASLVAAVAFAAFHALGQEGTAALDAGPFAFRTLAGLVFAGLFWLRGFGVTVGTHACYNVITVVLASLSAGL